MNSLTGKNIIVTGATGGIGRSIIEKLYETGANILATGTKAEKLNELKSNFQNLSTLKFDISQTDKVEEFIENATNDLGGSLDCLINNAGITRDNLFMRMSDEEWQTVLDINLTATMKLCKGVMRGMMKNRWGRIINISSVVGSTGNPGQANYAASKAGMVGMSKSLAFEVASRGITVNIIAPGFIETPMTDKLNEDQKTNIMAQIPAGRMGTTSEIASAALYLASPEASYLTGATLHINGGMAMILSLIHI